MNDLLGSMHFLESAKNYIISREDLEKHIEMQIRKPLKNQGEEEADTYCKLK